MIDDDNGLRTLVVRVVERAGYAVDSAPDGQAGPDRLADRTYDVIVCDHAQDGWRELSAAPARDAAGDDMPNLSARDGEHGASRRHALSAALTAVGLVLAAAGTGAGDKIPAPPFYELLPANYPYPLIRVCSTQEGICAVPYYLPPGEPCSCVRPDSVWVSGVVTH